MMGLCKLSKNMYSATVNQDTLGCPKGIWNRGVRSAVLGSVATTSYTVCILSNLTSAAICIYYACIQGYHNHMCMWPTTELL